MTQALYASAKDLRSATSDVELSQVATSNGTPVDVAALNAAIDDPSPPGAATPDVVAAYTNIVDALTRASSLMDTRLRAVYVLPLVAPLPVVLRDYACTIARYDLNRNRATDEMRKRYEDALKDLDKIAAGTLNIGATGTDSAPASVGVAFVAPVRDNTYTTLGNFAPGGYQGWPYGYCR